MHRLQAKISPRDVNRQRPLLLRLAGRQKGYFDVKELADTRERAPAALFQGSSRDIVGDEGQGTNDAIQSQLGSYDGELIR